MECVHFCAELFPLGVRKLLFPFKYDDLPLKNEILDSPTRFLLKKCAETFFHAKGFKKEAIYEKLPDCLETTKVLLDLSWEKLNTGCWKDVDIAWRYVYSYASLFKMLCLLLSNSYDRKELIKICDMGLLMGAPILNNVLSKLASELMSEDQQKDLKADDHIDTPPESKRRKIPSVVDPAREVHVRKWVSCGEFREQFLKTSKPLLLLSVISHWPAVSNHKWSVDYILEKARHRTVPVEIGSKYTDDSWSQKLMTIEEFVKKYIRKEEDGAATGYLAQHNLFDQIPELKDDIKVPLYIKDLLSDKTDADLEKEVDVNAWFGPENTISPLHYDPKNNFLVQLMGEKYVRLYSQEQTPYLYPREGTIFSNTSLVDVENPDLDSYPMFSKAEYKECILKAGNMLYIPPKCWHYVRSQSVSFSVSYWW